MVVAEVVRLPCPVVPKSHDFGYGSAACVAQIVRLPRQPSATRSRRGVSPGRPLRAHSMTRSTTLVLLVATALVSLAAVQPPNVLRPRATLTGHKNLVVSVAF